MNIGSQTAGDNALDRGQKLVRDAFKDLDYVARYVIPEKVNDVFMTRDNQGVHVNVPHRVVYHSPTGFDYGYGGSGPADLALNILVTCVPVKQAWVLHQRFKWKFIANMPYEGGTIKGEEIRSWIAAQEERETKDDLL